MNISIPHSKRAQGFSLIELAIVLLITGILMAAGLSLLTVKRSAAQLDATQKNQEAIKQALINYLGQYKRLPCPGDITGQELPRSGTATVPPCPSYAGIVPFQTLGLDRSAALDGWENFITYVVSPYLSQSPSAQPVAPAPILTTAWLYSYNGTTASNVAPYTMTTRTNPANPWTTPPMPPFTLPTLPDAAFWPSSSTGGIVVKGDGGTVIATPAMANGAVVVLISYGKTGYGATNIKGVQNLPLPVGADELQNLSPASGVPTVVKRDTTDSTAGGGSFDDVVMMLSADDLVSPLTAKGTLQANAQAALSQANDIVMGSIVASRTNISPICSTNYYYKLPPLSPPPSFPYPVSSWGVIYNPSIPAVGSCTASGTAYTLTAGDGTQRIVTVSELIGILARTAGFD